jgi:integrase
MQDKFVLGKYWLGQVAGSERYYAFWYDAGTREVRRKSLKTASADDAKIRLAALVLSDGETKTRDPADVTLISVLNRYWTEHSDRRPNPSGARRAGTLLLDFLGNDAAKVSDLTKAKQIEYLHWLHAEHGYAVAYISRQQAVIAAALRRAVGDGEGMLARAPKVIVSPVEISAILDEPEPEPDNWHPTIEQVAAFMDACTDQRVLRMAVLTLAFAGRPLAVRALRAEQFDERHGLLAFNADGRRQTKKHRPTVPVPSRLLPYIMEWLREGIGTIRKPWDATLLRAGLPDKFKPKALRHFMATEMRKRGVPQEQRELWMGHRRHSTGDRYGVFTGDYLKAARDCADAVLGELEALCSVSPYRQVAAKSGYGNSVPTVQRFDPIEDFGAGEGSRTPDPNLGKVKRSA